MTVIDHREPDRVPIDCGAMRSTGIQAIGYAQLKKHLGITQGATRIFDVIQQLAEPEDWYLERFGIDAINAGREFAVHGWQPWTLPDGSPSEIPDYLAFTPDGEGGWTAGVRGQPASARMIPGATYFSQTCYPLAREDWESGLSDLGGEIGRVCWADLAEPIFADGFSPANLERIQQHLVALRAKHQRAIMIAYGANLFEWGCYLRRMDNFLMDLVGDRPRAERLLDALVEAHLAGLDALMPVAGPHVDLIQLGDDLGMESGVFFSPQLFRELFKPRYKLIIDRIKQHAPHVKVFLHSCGSIRKLLGDLIEAGVEVINPVQIAAHDMAPAELKKEFGKDVTFWGGGCDTQSVLPRGTPAEVRDHVRRNLDIFAPGGGFVFNQVHNILSEVPPENIVAMYEAALE